MSNRIREGSHGGHAVGIIGESCISAGWSAEGQRVVNKVAVTVRYCRGCGARLAADRSRPECEPCGSRERVLLVAAPQVPAEFWAVDQMRDALDSWHMGRVIAAYRTHPYHRRPLSQELVGGWIGLTQAQLSRIEHGSAIKDLDRLILWAQTLRVPSWLLWFKLPEQRPISVGDRYAGATASQGIDERLAMSHRATIEM